MTEEYISREAALSEFSESSSAIPEKFALYRIESIPIANVKPAIKAMWVKIGKLSPHPGFKCSYCNSLAPTGFMGGFARTKYCPSCGAQMIDK